MRLPLRQPALTRASPALQALQQELYPEDLLRRDLLDESQLLDNAGFMALYSMMSPPLGSQHLNLLLLISKYTAACEPRIF